MQTDEALFERVVGGDLAAFDVLYARYEVPLFGFLRAHLSNPRDAEDALHETFLVLLREQGRGQRVESFRGWLYGVARNVCLGRLRGTRREGAALEKEAQAPVAPVEPADALLARHQQTTAVHQAVARLPAPLAELYHLRARGLSYDELARALDVPLGTVKSRLHDLVSRLREELTS